jgi:hypothetical protein
MPHEIVMRHRTAVLACVFWGRLGGYARCQRVRDPYDSTVAPPLRDKMFSADNTCDPAEACRVLKARRGCSFPDVRPRFTYAC